MAALGAWLLRVASWVGKSPIGRLIFGFIWDKVTGAISRRWKEYQRKRANEAAMKKAEEGDQRDIETQLGNDRAGSPSGTPGAVIVDDLPGLHNPKRD